MDQPVHDLEASCSPSVDQPVFDLEVCCSPATKQPAYDLGKKAAAYNDEKVSIE